MFADPGTETMSCFTIIPFSALDAGNAIYSAIGIACGVFMSRIMSSIFTWNVVAIFAVLPKNLLIGQEMLHGGVTEI